MDHYFCSPLSLSEFIKSNYIQVFHNSYPKLRNFSIKFKRNQGDGAFALSNGNLRTLFSDFGDAQLVLGAGHQTLLQKSQKQRLFDLVFKFRLPAFIDGFILHGCRLWTFKDDLRFHPDRLIIRLCRAHSRYEFIAIPPWTH